MRDNEKPKKRVKNEKEVLAINSKSGKPNDIKTDLNKLSTFINAKPKSVQPTQTTGSTSTKIIIRDMQETGGNSIAGLPKRVFYKISL